ncbi:LytTR family transcriptional regulator DNA-binding domain-containing protein [Halobacillus sp. MO56]
MSIKQLEKNIGNTVVFPKFDLEVHSGETVAVQCNPKAGSSLINTVTGLLPSYSGEISLFGQHLKDNYREFCHRVSVVFLEENLYERLTIREFLTFYKRIYGVEEDITFTIQLLGLSEKESVKIKKLSFSEKRRVLIARAIINQPDLIILEEPDQNLDIESNLIIRRLINDLTSQGKSFLITSSYLESAISFTDIVYQLNEDGLKKIDVAPEESQVDDQKEKSNIAEEETTANHNQVENEQTQPETFTSLHTPSRLKIPAKVNEKIILFDPTEIDMIESVNGVSHLHVKGEAFPCSFKLNDLNDRLYPFGFFQCHRSYIVNLQKVREVITWTRNSYSLILDNEDKTTIPLSKNNFKKLKEIIGL